MQCSHKALQRGCFSDAYLGELGEDGGVVVDLGAGAIGVVLDREAVKSVTDLRLG